MTINLFIGPYVELLTDGKYPDCPEDLSDEWALLLDDHERLEWNFNRGSPPTIPVHGRPMWQWCAVPIAERDNPPRWPLRHYPEDWWTGEGFSLALLRGGASGTEPGSFALHLHPHGTPPIHQVAPKVELDWFASAYAEDLRLLGLIFGHAPSLRWGMVSWVSG